MRRLFAILGAALMIVGALVLRGRMDGDGPGTITDRAGPRGTLVCITELQTLCEEIARQHPDVTVRVEDAGITADALMAREFDRAKTPLDAWLTIDPYPAMVAEARSFASLDALLDTSGFVLGRSPLVMVAFTERADALRPACGGRIDWVCVGDAAGRPWTDVGVATIGGRVEVGLSDPVRSVTGLLILGEGVRQRNGNTDPAAISLIDLEEPQTRQWIGNMRTASDSKRFDLTAMLGQGPSQWSFAGSIEAVAGPAVLRSQRAPSELVRSAPPSTANVVVARSTGSADAASLQRLLESDDVRGQLAELGWRVEGQPLADGIDPAELPATNGLPSPGVLLALRNA